MRLVDLSAPIRQDPEEWPDVLRTDIEYESHAEGAKAIETIFGVQPELLRDREGWTTETFLRFGTHNSTHVDAPWHYNSTIGGKPAQPIDRLPLEWFYAPAVIVDATNRDDGEVLTAADVQERVPRELNNLDIVLVRSGRDEFYGQPEYMAKGPGVSADATRWLYDQGVRVMGIDAWGWDAPLFMQAEEAKRTGKTDVFWAAHQVDLDYCQIERLMNLGALPDEGFQIACFPLRIEGASAAPARVVAILAD